MSHLYYISECLSTNDEILRFLPYSESQPLGVYTFKQTKGKGQYGNTWESSENLNIAISIAVDCERTNVSHNLFNFRTANILRDFLAILTKTNVEIKWPNDIILKNKKISGMLIEKKKVGEKYFYIIGIGLNVMQKNFENLPKAGSLHTQTGEIFDLKNIAELLHSYFSEQIFIEKSDEEILNKFNENLYRKDLVSVFQKNGLRQNGIIKYCDKDGKILIDLENEGLKLFFHKEIELLY